MLFEKRLKKEINSILNPKRIRRCPYCGYRNQYGKCMGIRIHMKKKHPDKYQDKTTQLINLIKKILAGAR